MSQLANDESLRLLENRHEQLLAELDALSVQIETTLERVIPRRETAVETSLQEAA